MIKVKKTRADAGQDDPIRPYRFDDGAPKGGLPQAIAMAILSVAFYLRSMVAGPAESAGLHGGATPPEPPSTTPHDPQVGAGPATAAPDATPPQAPFADPDASAFVAGLSISTGRNVVSLFSGSGAGHAQDKPAHHGLFVPQGGSELPSWTLPFGHAAHGSHGHGGRLPVGSGHAGPAAPAGGFPWLEEADGPDAPVPDTTTGTPAPVQEQPALPDTPAATPGQPGVPNGQPARPNRAPVRLRSVTLDDILGTGAILIGTASLVEHVTDPDGDALRVTDITVSAGSLTPVAGGILYTPDPHYAGVVQFSYQVTDGTAAVTQMAHLIVQPATQAGTVTADHLIGTDGIDVISGGDGDDDIAAQDADDVVLGGAGDDIIHAGAGDDLIYGGAGDDLLFGEAGRDRIDGGDGDDMIYGGTGADVLTGGTGDDALFGGDGDDVMDGGAGDDVLSDGAGADIVIGGAGDDTVHATADAADDIYMGDARDAAPEVGAMDTLDYGTVTASLHIDMTLGTADSSATGHDSFTGFEILISGAGDDVIIGSAAADVLFGGAGRDEIYGGAGDDIMTDGGGADRVTGGTGSDTIRASADHADDTFQGDAEMPGAVPDAGAVDTLDYSAISVDLHIDIAAGRAESAESGCDTFDGFEVVISGAGDDVVIDGADGDTVILGDGDDTMIVTQDMSADTFKGGAGSDTLDLSRAESGLRIDLGDGRIDGEAGPADHFMEFEIVIGTSSDDTFVIGSDTVTLTGGAGADRFRFGSVEDSVTSAARITDFSVGDTIETRLYRLFEDDGGASDSGLRLDGGDLPDALKPFNVTFSYETGADGDTTHIDIHEDDMFDAFITLSGHHVLILHDAH